MSSSPALPSDVLFNILLHLPVKTLCRFRCVSKSLSSLISSPTFLKHSLLQRSEQNPLLFVATCEEQPRTTRWCSKPTQRNHIRTLNKHGTVLDHQITPEAQQPWCWPYDVVFSSSLDLVCFSVDDHVYIRNPATREQITLPASRFRSEESKKVQIFHRQLGFAYISSESEYKVLQIFQKKPKILGESLEVSYICEVFTLGGGCWRAVESPPFVVDHQQDMAVFDEAVYLVPDCSLTGVITCMARFDLKKEEWSVLPFPAGTGFYSSREWPDCFVRHVGGRRGLCMVSLIHETKKLDLWFLKNCNTMDWVKEYSIDIPESAYLDRWPLAIEEDGRVLFQIGKNGRRGGKVLCFYDPKDGKYEEIYAGTASLRTCLYVESFMSLTNQSFRALKDRSA